MITVKDNRAGWDALLQRVNTLRGASLTVGIHGDDAAREDGGNNVLIGAVHEFGTDKVPARPFLRPGVAMAASEIGAEAATGLRAVVAGTSSPMKVLSRMGNLAIAGVYRRIDSNINPPLSKATIEKRIRRTAKGRKTLNAAAKSTRLLSRGGLQYVRRGQPFGKGAWKQTKITAATIRKAHRQFDRVRQLQGGRFTALVDTGNLKKSIAYKVHLRGAA